MVFRLNAVADRSVVAEIKHKREEPLVVAAKYLEEHCKVPKRFDVI